MAELILARHGETAWNLEKTYRRRSDVELNEVGIRQAELLGQYLINYGLKAIYSSPLRRALGTANGIAPYQKIDVQIAEGLIDFDYGNWQGMTERVVENLCPALLYEWRNNPHKVRMPGGESLEDVRRRAIGVVNDILANCHGNVVIVSHRVVNKVLMCSLLGPDNSHFWNIKQDVAEITVFSDMDGRFALTKRNGTSHLKELQKTVLDDF